MVWGYMHVGAWMCVDKPFVCDEKRRHRACACVKFDALPLPPLTPL